MWKPRRLENLSLKLAELDTNEFSQLELRPGYDFFLLLLFFLFLIHSSLTSGDSSIFQNLLNFISSLCGEFSHFFETASSFVRKVFDFPVPPSFLLFCLSSVLFFLTQLAFFGLFELFLKILLFLTCHSERES